MKARYKRLTEKDRLNIVNYLDAYIGTVVGEDETTKEAEDLIRKIWFKTRNEVE